MQCVAEYATTNTSMWMVAMNSTFNMKSKLIPIPENTIYVRGNEVHNNGNIDVFCSFNEERALMGSMHFETCTFLTRKERGNIVF